MPTTITDVDVFTDPVTAPADGDNADEATFQDPIQDLANRTRYNKNRIDELYGGTVTLTEDLNFAGSFSVYFPLHVNVTENLYVAGDTFLYGDQSVAGALTVTGDITVDDLTVTDDLTVNDDATVNGDLSCGGRAFADAFRFTSGLGTNADATLTVLVTAQMLVTRTLTANRDYTISDTGAQNGDFFFIKNDTTSGFTIAVKKPGGTNIASLADGESCLAVRVDGVWSALNFEL